MASIAPESAGLLVDTSAWIELFRRQPDPAIAVLAGELDRAVTCLPVIQEVLQGFADESLFRAARTAMYTLPCVEAPLSASVVDDAVDLYRRARRAGITVRSSVDCLIAACAVRHHLAVVHCDRDFAALAKLAPLQHHAIRQRA